MLNFLALKVLVFQFLGSNMVVRIKYDGFKTKHLFLEKNGVCGSYGAKYHAHVQLKQGTKDF